MTKAIRIPRPPWCLIPKAHGACNVNNEHTHCLLAECNDSRAEACTRGHVHSYHRNELVPGEWVCVCGEYYA